MSKNSFLDSSDLLKAHLRLNPTKESSKVALMRSLNRTLEHAATVTKKEVTNVYALNQKTVGSTFKKHKAYKSSLKAYLVSKGKRIELSFFKFSPNSYKKNAKVVKVRIKKGEGMKPIVLSPSAFVQTIYGDSPKIYQRKDKRKLPVRTKLTMAVPQMIEQEKVESKIQNEIKETFEKRLSHELKREIEKAVKKK